MIDPRRRCIFIHQRKAAGTSIISAFGWSPKSPEWRRYNNGVLSPEWQTRTAEERAYFVFSAVRNPFDRFVSGWKYLPKYANQPILAVLRNMPRAGEDDYEYRHLARPQVAILRDPATGALVTDAIVRFERLQQDFDAVCERLGMAPVPLPHLNPWLRAPDYRRYFNDEAREIAGEIFREDLDTFGYTF